MEADESISGRDDGLRHGSDALLVDFHCHGIGPFDFAQPGELVMERIETQLREERVYAVLTLYVPRNTLALFCDFCRVYERLRRTGGVTRILGIATEGPLFSSVGGTPRSGKWIPKKSEWAQFTQLGAYGLRYMVLSPDALWWQEPREEYPESLEWIVDALYEAGITPALGHFSKQCPHGSARAVHAIADHVARRGYAPFFTDHLFNDMPLNFKHAWRGPAEKPNRAQELSSVDPGSWNIRNLEQRMGAVPAALIRAARDGLAKICMNFDGEHVDLEVCRHAVRVIGAEHLMMMTDRIQSGRLAGQQLSRRAGSALLYQSDGIVAGGTSAPRQQVANLYQMGLSQSEVMQIAGETAWSALKLLPSQGQPRRVAVEPQSPVPWRS